jgi:hypothetical protein
LILILGGSRMTDPIGYLVQNIVNPKLDAVILMIVPIGVILLILIMTMDFFGNKKLEAYLLDIQEKFQIFIEKKRIHE